MAHNLMVHLEGKVAAEEGVRNEVEAKRREKRMQEKIKVSKEAEREAPLMRERPRPSTQRCAKFIRWIRCRFFVQAGMPSWPRLPPGSPPAESQLLTHVALKIELRPGNCSATKTPRGKIQRAGTPRSPQEGHVRPLRRGG